MARQTRDSKIETRTARERLAASPKPYWRGLEEGLHLGYRKPKSGAGAWLARTRNEAGAYRETVIGKADDFEDADDVLFLSYAQAQRRARDARLVMERAARGIVDVRQGPYAIADAMADYESDFVRRGGKAIQTIKSVSAAHILPALGNVALERLSTERLRKWHAGLASGAKMVRTAKGKKRQRREHDPNDADSVRRRRSTANRILTVLKAALNHAFAEGKVASDDAWRRVKPFRSADAARIRFLTARECTRLIKGCDPALRPLARAALLTGARYGELTRLQVGDVSLGAKTIFIAESKSGRPRHIHLTDEGVALFRDLAQGRASGERMFIRQAMARMGRDEGQFFEREWRRSEADRFMQSASKAARIEPAVRFHDLRHAYASLLVSAGVPIAFVAEALGHSDTRITSANYAHLAPSSVAESIRGALPRFADDSESNVVTLETGTRK